MIWRKVALLLASLALLGSLPCRAMAMTAGLHTKQAAAVQAAADCHDPAMHGGAGGREAPPPHHKSGEMPACLAGCLLLAEGAAPSAGSQTVKPITECGARITLTGRALLPPVPPPRAAPSD